MSSENPIRPTDADACTLARSLIDQASFGALGVLDAETQNPAVTRIAIATDPDGQPFTLISDLSAHTRSLRADPRCSLLLGEPGPKGDPLTHPRISLTCKAHFVEHSDDDFPALRAHYLGQHPKAKLYIDFADFAFAALTIERAALNGGFGKAFLLTPEDLRG